MEAVVETQHPDFSFLFSLIISFFSPPPLLPLCSLSLPFFDDARDPILSFTPERHDFT